jgi:hypothetical protein
MTLRALGYIRVSTAAQVFGEPPEFSAPRMAEAMAHLRLSPESIAEVAAVIEWVRTKTTSEPSQGS